MARTAKGSSIFEDGEYCPVGPVDRVLEALTMWLTMKLLSPSVPDADQGRQSTGSSHRIHFCCTHLLVGFPQAACHLQNIVKLSKNMGFCVYA